MSALPSTKRVLVTSFLVDALDISMNAVVAFITGSVVMLVESVQGVADLVAVTLLLVGNRRSRHRATKQHPFGFGKEIYFWTVLSAFILLLVTAGFSFYFGLKEFRNPTPVEDISLAYVILGIGVISNGYSFMLSARRLLGRQPVRHLSGTLMRSTQVGTRTACVLDLMGTTAATLGLTALILYKAVGWDRLDGLGGIAMSVALASFAGVLLASLRGLIAGQSAPAATEHAIREAALGVPEVQEVIGLQTMLLGTENTLVTIEVHLQNNLDTDDVEQTVSDIKKHIEAVAPGMNVHVEPTVKRQ